MLTKEQAKVGQIIRWDETNPQLYRICDLNDQEAMVRYMYYDNNGGLVEDKHYQPYKSPWANNRMVVIFDSYTL